MGLQVEVGRVINKLPMAVNPRLENINNRYWQLLLKKGRAIVPANGWYEWTGARGQKQPWHIHRKDGSPLYLAALASFQPASEIKTLHAFTIITADAQGGVIDGQDRPPLVLTAQDAAVWLDPDLPREQADMRWAAPVTGPHYSSAILN